MHPTAIGVIVVLASIFWHAILGLFRAVRKWAILSRLPHPSSSSSLFGSFELIKDVDHIPQILTEVADRLGGIFSIRILGVSSVIVTDPELIDALLTLQKDPIIYGIMSCIVSPDGKTPHMLSHARNDGYWLKIRRQVLPAFSQSNVRKRFPSIVEKIERLCEILEAKHRCDPDLYFDVDNLFQRQALDVMAQIGFATEFGTMDRLHPLRAALARDGEKDHYTGSKTNGSSRDYESDVSIQDDIFQLFRAASTEVTLRANSAFRQTFRHVLPSARKGTKDLLEVQRRMKQFVNEVRERYGYRPPPEDDISVAAQLLRLSDMSDLQMAGEFTLFLYSGFETTGHAMAWTIYLLCRHPEASAEVLDQLNEMGLLKTKDRPNPRKVEYSDVLSLQRGALGRFIKETMRMIPVVSGGTARYTPVPMKLGSYDIPAGTTFFLLTHGLHNGKRIWEKPNEFLPDRWRGRDTDLWCPSDSQKCIPAERSVTGREKSNESNGPYIDGLDNAEPSLSGDDKRRIRRYLPFSSGIRSCIGQNLAQMNMLATLATVFSRFEFKISDELNSDAAQYELQITRITTFPDWHGQGLPVLCRPR